MRFQPLFQQRKFLIFLSLLMAATAITLMGQGLSGLAFVRKAQLASQGVYTCFHRLNQSFMAAKLKLSGSEYLSSSFFQSSENCLGETIATFPYGEFSQETMQLQETAQDVFQFHLALEKGTLRSSLFSEIEGSIFELSSHIHDGLAKEVRSLGWQWTLALVMAWALGSLLVFLSRGAPAEVSHLSQRSLGPQEIEARPSVQMDVASCIPPVRETISVDGPQEDRVITDRPEQDAGQEGVHLASQLQGLLKHFQGLIQGKEIKVSLEVDEEIYLEGEEESIQQILYMIIRRGLQSASENMSKREMVISSQSLGKEIKCHIFDSGIGFPQTWENTPVQTLAREGKLDRNTSISFQLLKENFGDMLFRNYRGKSLEERGGEVVLIFKRAQAPHLNMRRKEVQVSKGKKRDLLKVLKKGFRKKSPEGPSDSLS